MKRFIFLAVSFLGLLAVFVVAVLAEYNPVRSDEAYLLDIRRVLWEGGLDPVDQVMAQSVLSGGFAIGDAELFSLIREIDTGRDGLQLDEARGLFGQLRSSVDSDSLYGALSLWYEVVDRD